MKMNVRSILSVMVLGLGAVSAAHALAVPEIDGSMASTGLVLLAGAALVIRGRQKR